MAAYLFSMQVAMVVVERFEYIGNFVRRSWRQADKLVASIVVSCQLKGVQQALLDHPASPGAAFLLGFPIAFGQDSAFRGRRQAAFSVNTMRNT
jgi:hypothetical protein